MITVARAVNFGVNKASLTTVGYRLINSDGSERVSRTTSGVTEVLSGKGIYGGEIIFDEGWSGFVVWDTGEGTPQFAVDQYDYRHFLSFAPIYGGPVTTNASNKKELDKITSLTKQVIQKIDQIPDRINAVNDNVSRVLEGFRSTNHVNMDTILEAISKTSPRVVDLREEIKALKESIEMYLSDFNV